MERRLLYAAAAAVVVVAVSLFMAYQFFTATQFKPSIEIQPVPMPDIKLVDQHGREFNLQSIEGKPVFLFFGYSNCPDICPLTLLKYSYVMKNLGDQADDIAFIFITQDPWRDTPEALRIWVSRFDDRIIALTGTPEQLAKIWKAYNVPSYYTDEKGNKVEDPAEYARSGKPYFVVHMSFVLVADRDHILRFALSSEMSQEEYLAAARYILSR